MVSVKFNHSRSCNISVLPRYEHSLRSTLDLHDVISLFEIASKPPYIFVPPVPSWLRWRALRLDLLFRPWCVSSVPFKGTKPCLGVWRQTLLGSLFLPSFRTLLPRKRNLFHHASKRLYVFFPGTFSNLRRIFLGWLTPYSLVIVRYLPHLQCSPRVPPNFPLTESRGPLT